MSRSLRESSHIQPLLTFAAVATLLAMLWFQLWAIERHTSMSWDEGQHLFDGYTVLTAHDYALNPEVPPFAKILALPTAPPTLFAEGRERTRGYCS